MALIETEQDLVKGLDPTAFNAITGAELAQLVDAGIVGPDRGLNIWTVDTGSTPNVPNANSIGRFFRYTWTRVLANSVKFYVWNPYQENDDPNLLNWQDLTNIALSAGIITNTMLAGGITSDKISSVNWSSILSVPSFIINTTNPTAGDVSGSYLAGFTIGANKVLTAMIADAQVTAAKLGPLVGAKMVQEIYTEYTTRAAAAEFKANSTDALIYSMVDGNGPIALAALTPKATDNIIVVEALLHLSASGAAANMIAGLWVGGPPAAGDECLSAALAYSAATNAIVPVHVRYAAVAGTLDTRVYRVGYTSTAAVCNINGPVGGLLNGKLTSWIRATEYRP